MTLQPALRVGVRVVGCRRAEQKVTCSNTSRILRAWSPWPVRSVPLAESGKGDAAGVHASRVRPDRLPWTAWIMSFASTTCGSSTSSTHYISLHSILKGLVPLSRSLPIHLPQTLCTARMHLYKGSMISCRA